VFERIDLALLRLMRTEGHQPAVETIVKGYSKLGEHGMLWYALCAVGAAVDPDRRGYYGRAAAKVAESFLANQAIKLFVRRPRPDLPDLPPLIHTMSNRSYPSAHAATCGAAGVALANPVIWAAAVTMALTRPYLGVHYPSDTVAGFALGVAVAKL
jgi:undecaprenyl-diphosphatase